MAVANDDLDAKIAELEALLGPRPMTSGPVPAQEPPAVNAQGQPIPQIVVTPNDRVQPPSETPGVVNPFYAGPEQTQGLPLPKAPVAATAIDKKIEDTIQLIQGQTKTAPTEEEAAMVARNKALQSPEGKAITGAVAPWFVIPVVDETGKAITPADMPTDMGPIMNLLGSFNRQVATALSVPTEVANDFLGLVGTGVFKPGAATEHIAQQMQQLGINTHRVDGLMAQIGRDSFNDLAMLSALTANAARLAQRTGQPVRSFLIQEFNKSLLKNPYLGILAGQGGVVGGNVATHLYPDQPLAAVPGAIAGSFATTTVAKTGQAIAKPVVKGVTNIGRSIAETFGLRPAGAPLQDPLLHPGFDISRTPTMRFAENQIQGSVAKMELAIKDAIESVPVTGTPAQTQAQMRKLLEQAEKIGARIESDYWNRVPLKERVPVSGLQQQLYRMKTELADRPFVTPTDKIDELIELTSPLRGPDGKMVRAMPTVERLRDFRAEIRNARKTEEGKSKTGQAVNYGKIRNYNRLEAMIDDTIMQALPNNTEIQQARAVSIKYNDLFSRGPVADVLATRARGDEVVPPGQTVEALMETFGGIGTINRIQRELSRIPAAGTTHFTRPFTHAASAPERQALKDMVAATEDAIRSMFRENAATPQDAIKFAAKLEPMIAPLARVSTELKIVTDTLKQQLDVKQMIEKSALQRFTKMSEPQKAIADVWNSKNPTKTSEELMRTFGRDPDALAGYRSGVLVEFWQRTKFDPIAAMNTLQTPRFRDLMQSALSPEEFARLNKMVTSAFRIASGDDKKLRKAVAPGIGMLALGSVTAGTGHALDTFVPGMSLLAGIFGAGVGRKVAQMTGGGNIQVPALMASSSRRAVARMFANTPPETLLNMAVLSPQWEKILYSRVPINTAEMRHLTNNMRRAIATMEGSRQAGLRYLTNQEE